MNFRSAANITLIAALSGTISCGQRSTTIESSTKNPHYISESQQTITKLKTTNDYTVLITATWCAPCRELEHIMKTETLSPNATIYRETTQDKDSLYTALNNNGINEPEGIPTIMKNENGKVRLYTGLGANEKMLGDNGQFLEIKKILEKN